MNIIFEQVDKFLSSIRNFWSYSEIFVLAIGLFLFTIVCVIISTSHAYEARLIKAIDMFNNYFIDNPQINENNLVAFNAKMKTRKVPKQLRKQWQQFVLYREGKASEYMSFETCVSTPIKNSTFKRDVVTMNIISYILAAVSFLINIYISYEPQIEQILPHAILAPVVILLLNYIVTIFLDLRHNAIVSDLYSNYQYFEVNIDKATQTLPEYVDYEVLFDKNEIKKGIPILYAYLQKRAEEEQRELERARLRNVEHEKFNFDEAGVESSLVLDRAMQEAENYIAERKKYMQDMQQINAEISQEEINFREITKEYQRQMQVSKESFDNYKAQLSEASSTIESNYLKKQQQQELDRQRNLERDYDTSTDRHKKVIESYQAELTTIEGFIAEARKTLERGMMSEFETYSNKVYDSASKVVEERELEKTTGLKNKIQELEEQLSAKSKELEYVYSQNQVLSEKFDQQANEYQQKLDRNKQVLNRVSDEISRYNNASTSMENSQTVFENPAPAQEEYTETYSEAEEPAYENTYNEPVYEETYAEPTYEQPIEQTSEDADFNYSPYQETEQSVNKQADDNMSFSYSPYQETEEPVNSEEVDNNTTFNYSPYAETETNAEPVDDNMSFNYSPYAEETPASEQPQTKKVNINPFDEDTEPEEDEEPVQPRTTAVSGLQKIRWVDDDDEDADSGIETSSTEAKVESIIPKRKAGRPRKVVTEEKTEQPKRRGRPRKVVDTEISEPKRKAGRPRKTESAPVAVKKGRGRPRKVVDTETIETPKRKAGRPKKVETASAPVKKGRGRPKKVETIETEQPKRRGRPKKVVENLSTEPKRKAGRPRKTESAPVAVKKGRGRPKKITTNTVEKIDDIDVYLREINEEIAKENAKIAESAKALEKKAKISKKK